ncbi:hypothetical protein BDR03DRAFT_1017657 [Suillus americanus]|nr:hypothetical protein BDR03DRAFT_1017657 [Suillus americanus]
MSEITLYCWIRGTSIDQLSNIKISCSENMGALKRLLKESQAIDVPAPALRLYNPKDPMAEPHNENLRKVLLCDLGKPLPASWKLLILFKTAPPKEHIHIIVDAPRFIIHCWLQGTTTKEGFNVSIGWDAALGDLKDKMKEKEPRLEDVNNNHIRLYRISDSEDELWESLDTLKAGELLEAARSVMLSERFLHMPALQRLHVII